MYGIFIDDERNVEDVTWIEYPKGIQWYIINRAIDFEFFLSTCVIDDSLIDYYISFDHDIQSYDFNSNEITGYDLLKQMCNAIMDYNLGLPTVYFHTQNPVGRKNMETYWDNFRRVYNENQY
jgi:hypothetical protein